MKRYDKYKPSGIEWLGDIPEHWQVKKMKVISNITRGAILRPIDEPSYFDENGEWTYLNISDATKCDKYLYYGELKLSELGSNKSARVEPDNLILTASATIGKPVIPKIKVCIHDGFIAFKNIQVDINYLFHYLKNPQLYVAIGKSNTQKNIYLDEVKNITITVPSNQEQKQIVTFLDEKTPQIDKLIANKQKLIELLKEERTAIINQAVTKGINPHVKLKPSGIDWLGEIPEHWAVKKLNRITVTITNGFVGPTRDILTQEGVRYIQSLHIKENTIKFTFPYYVFEEWSNNHSRSILKEKDILVVQTGAGTGNIGIVPKEFEGCNCHALIIIRVNKGKTLPDFIMNVLTSNYGKHMMKSIETGALHPHLNSTKICDIELPIPPIEEQKQIVEIIETANNKIDTTITKIEKEIDLLQEYRTALISEAVTGKIKVV